MKRVSELEGSELDCWIARAEGLKKGQSNWVAYSTKWAVGGPIIEREGIELRKDLRHINIARIGGFEPDLNMPGDTPLIAAMRCYVASKFGEEVDDSETTMR